MARSHTIIPTYGYLEQKSTSSVTTSLSSTAAILYSSSETINYYPDAPSEMSRVYIPPVLTTTILEYLAGDIDTQEESKIEKTSLLFDKKCLTLFGRNCYELMAHKAATLILEGEEKDANEVIVLLKNNAALLDYSVAVTDPCGRSIKQKIFEIAFMAGEFDLKAGIVKENEKGLVERIISACSVSQARINEAKQVLLSEEAIKENAKKTQLIFDVFKKFGENIINLPPNENEKNENISRKQRISAYRLRCNPVIAQYKEDLKLAQSGVIQYGYIFDPNILAMADKWFEENLAHLGGWWGLQSVVVDINGYGTLQGELSSRDAQITKSGVGNLVDKGSVPARSLKNTDGTSYFYNSQSRLGMEFLVGYYGWPVTSGRATQGWRLAPGRGGKLTQHVSNPSESCCSIM